MIKLFASDIDGTMMEDDGSELDPRYFEAIKKMKERGILFCVGSGRQYTALQRLFEPVRDDIAYITQNGSSLFYREELLFSSSMTKEDSEQLVRDTYAIPGAQVMYCTDTTTYCGKNDWDCYRLMKDKFHYDIQMVDDPTKLPMPCVKYSLFLKEDVEEKCAPYFIPHWSKTHEVACGGKYFMDVMKRGTTKGGGLVRLMEKLGISPDEAIACGDNSNDIEMLRAVTHSVAVANARPEVKAICRYTTDSNNDLGVLKVMNQLICSSSVS